MMFKSGGAIPRRQHRSHSRTSSLYFMSKEDLFWLASPAGMAITKAGRKVTTDFRDRAYGSYVEFYEDVYADVIAELHPAGRTGAKLMRAEQGAGDWSDAATPDLVIVVPRTHGIDATLDLGAGQFKSNCPFHSFAVIPPAVATTVLVGSPHQIQVFGVPFKGLVELVGDTGSLPANGDFGVLHARMQSSAEITVLFDRLFAEMRQGNPHGALYADSALLRIAAGLLELRDGPKPAAVPAFRGGLAPWQVKRVCEAMIAAMDAGEPESSLG